MNKRELILAKKTYEANQLKNKQRSMLSTAHGMSSPLRSYGSSYGVSYEAGESLASTYPSPDGAASIAMSPMQGRPQTSTLSPLRVKTSRDHKSRDGPATDSALAELARRGLTDEAKLRKMTIEAMNKTRRRGNSTVIGVPDDANYFMPKVQKLRPDGASLLSVYDSKRQDMWGKIIRAQVVEDEQGKREKRKQLEHANHEYSALLTQQVHEKEEVLRREREIEKKTAGFSPGGMFEIIDEKQKMRDEMAKLHHVEYVSNAMHDMRLKREQKDRFLQSELEGAAVLAREAEFQAELERQRIRRKKEEQISRTERLFKENVELIEERARQKALKDKADIAYVKEVDAKFEREERARRMEVEKRFKKANSDGPANTMTAQLKEMEKKEQERLFETLRQAENSLSRQLKKSEDLTEERNYYKKTCLMGEYDKVLAKNKIKMEQINREKEKAHNDIIDFQKKYKHDLQLEKKKNVAAAARYQAALNEQLEGNRMRSLNALEETMTEKERKFNSDLLHRLLK